MLRTVLIGPKHFSFVQMLAHWLASRSKLTGAVWTDATAWNTSWTGRAKFTMRRLKRHGLIKVTDEVLFFLYYRSFLLRRDNRDVKKRIVEPYWATHGGNYWTGDSIATDNVNSPAVLEFLTSLRADIVFTVCILNYFEEEIRAIPKLGVFLWHEGITPEYKGVYSAFWAIHNRDFGKVGYTLLKMNDVIDGGEVFAQGPAVDIDYRRDGQGYIAHKAIYDSLPDVERLLLELEHGTAQPLDRSDRNPMYYTYPGLTDLIRQRFRLWMYFAAHF